MSAEQQLKDGDIAAAMTSLKQQIRADAANPKYRVFLFQILAVTGDWQKALDQLNVVGELDASALPMVQAYRETIGCELLRKEIFAGGRSPLIMGDPEDWIARLLQSLGLGATGHWKQAEGLRNDAFEAATTTSGSIDGQPFEWIADADARLGPVLEAIVNGRYYWVPFNRIRQIDIEAPCDLRDAVWLPANFVWSSGGETVGFIPTRYVGSEQSEDNAIKLARKTIWQEPTADTVLGLGQRMLTTDSGEYSLMDVRKIVFDTLVEADSESETRESSDG